MPAALIWSGIDPFPEQFERNAGHCRACPSALTGPVGGANSFFWHLSNVLEGLGVLSSFSFLMNISCKIGFFSSEDDSGLWFMDVARLVRVQCAWIVNPGLWDLQCHWYYGDHLGSVTCRFALLSSKKLSWCIPTLSVLLRRLTPQSALKRWLFPLQCSNI